VIELALAVAERLLGRALAAEPEALAELLRRFREELAEAIPVEQAELDETAARVARGGW
jgi:hypothetical protein